MSDRAGVDLCLRVSIPLQRDVLRGCEGSLGNSYTCKPRVKWVFCVSSGARSLLGRGYYGYQLILQYTFLDYIYRSL